MTRMKHTAVGCGGGWYSTWSVASFNNATRRRAWINTTPHIHTRRLQYCIAPTNWSQPKPARSRACVPFHHDVPCAMGERETTMASVSMSHILPSTQDNSHGARNGTSYAVGPGLGQRPSHLQRPCHLQNTTVASLARKLAGGGDHVTVRNMRT